MANQFFLIVVSAVVSSAYLMRVADLPGMLSTNKFHKTGPRRLPCVTPISIGLLVDCVFDCLMTTLAVRFDKKLLVILMVFWFMPMLIILSIWS